MFAVIKQLPYHLPQWQGVRRNLFCLFLGVCATAALPPVFITPLVVIAFSGLLLLVNAARPWRAFWDGWWFGFGFFISGIYWIAISLLVDAEKFAWLIPFAVFGLSGLFAIYYGIACYAAALSRRKGLALWVLFAALWVAMEWLRGHLFTGFPWNLAGYVWNVSDVSLQAASVLGIYGLTWLTVLLASSPTLFFITEARYAKHAVTLALVLLAFSLSAGAVRLQNSVTATVSGIHLRIVQADIPQRLKWDPKEQIDGLKTHIRLTRSKGYEDITHVIWPETAFPFVLTEDSEATRLLGFHAPQHGALITGAVREEQDQERHVFNSVAALDHTGRIVATYDKVKLVPFGEFMPFRSILPIEKITGGMGDFDHGPGAGILTLDTAPVFSALICYEAIFPDYRVRNTDQKPQWIINVTNDAWFGTSSGPYQHFEAARMRAVEQGIPLIRAANTGISAVIDPYGRVLKSLALNTQGIVDSALPAELPNATLYSRWGEWLVLLLVLVSTGWVLTKR